MPITKSAEKALRQSKKRRARNIHKANAYKNAFKQLEKAVKNGEKDATKKLLATAYKAIDKAAKTGVIKKNKASRLKSSASRLLAVKAK